jgi:hypothetical protein
VTSRSHHGRRADPFPGTRPIGGLRWDHLFPYRGNYAEAVDTEVFIRCGQSPSECCRLGTFRSSYSPREPTAPVTRRLARPWIRGLPNGPDDASLDRQVPIGHATTSGSGRPGGGPMIQGKWRIYGSRNGGSPAKKELRELSKIEYGEVLEAMGRVAESLEPPPPACPQIGAVRCFRVPSESRNVQILWAWLEHKRALALLHVASSPTEPCPPEVAYQLAQARLNDAPA